MDSRRVAVVGIGRMGMPIAGHLRSAGYAVTVFDRDAGRMRTAAGQGLPLAESASAAAEGAEVLLTVLPGATEAEDVMLGAGRVVESLPPGSCWLDLTTNDPRVAGRVARSAAERTVDAVGAPMGGGVDAAAAAELHFYVGGPPYARERVMPILEVLSHASGVNVAGDDISSGYTAKLLINLLWFGQVAAVSEALLLGERLGLAAGTLRHLLDGSAADSAYVQRHLDRLLAGDYLPTFGLRECVDEIDILVSLAEVHHAPFSVSRAVGRLQHDALTRFGAVDGELMVARLLEEQSGIELRDRHLGTAGLP